MIKRKRRNRERWKHKWRTGWMRSRRSKSCRKWKGRSNGEELERWRNSEGRSHNENEKDGNGLCDILKKPTHIERHTHPSEVGSDKWNYTLLLSQKGF